MEFSSVQNLGVKTVPQIFFFSVFLEPLLQNLQSLQSVTFNNLHLVEKAKAYFAQLESTKSIQIVW